MPIPALNEDGFLPKGIHDCTLAEIRERFGQFQGTDQRCRLMERLEVFIHECRTTGFVRSIILDGSFVTDVDAPNDIDLLLVLSETHDFNAELRPFEYNVVSKRSIRRRFDFDAAVFDPQDTELAKAIDFFAQIRGQPHKRKGLLQVQL